MPLEDLTGNKYLDSLNPDWPAGTDYPSDGDDHMRGIKNVLQKTFPNITGPVSLTQDDLNVGSVPSGTPMLIYAAGAPVGWARTAGVGATYGVVIQASTVAGGGGIGVDDPSLNNKVPTHAHAVSGNTTNNNVGHVHYVSLGGGGHEHTYGGGQAAVVPGGAGAMQVGNGAYSTGGGGGHVHAGNSGGQNANHFHAFSVVSGVPTSGVTGNWVPRQLKMILCTKS